LKALLGIDFGTCTARAAVAVGRDVKMVTHAGGAVAIPAVVAFPSAASGGGPALVGAAAAGATARHPERTIAAVKRMLGRKLEAPEVRHHRQTVAYDLVGARNGDARVRVGRRHHAPQDIAAYLFGALRTAAERQVGGPVTDAVLAVPALFDDLQRQAIRDAARIAGLDVKGMLTETSASVLGAGLYPAAKGEERKVLAYHLGGGSFEVSALLLGERAAEVVACGGDGFLGGEDFDQRIVTYVCDEVLKAGGGDLRRDRSVLSRLKLAVEHAKIELSVAPRVDIQLPESPVWEAPAPVRLDRARLENLTQDLVDRTIWSCESVLREAKWSVEQVDLVLLVGGQTQMPRIRAQLEEICGKPPLEVPASDSLVALGAARQAVILAGGWRGRSRSVARSAITEVTSLSLGLESAGGVFTRLIPRGTPLPASLAQVFSTSVDGTTQIALHLLQGEREMASDNESVAHIQIGPLPARPRGEPQIEVEINTDGGGLPRVTARDGVTGEARQVRIRPSAGLGEAEIAALLAVHAAGPAAAAAASVSDMSVSEMGAADNEPDPRANEGIDPVVQGG
jgi:molecular chaperone DnaK